eukprot:scaffold30016_cov45-Isochrysis_galbana.AAC.1
MALAARWGLRGLAQMAAWGLERVFGYHMTAGFSDAGAHGGLPVTQILLEVRDGLTAPPSPHTPSLRGGL